MAEPSEWTLRKARQVYDETPARYAANEGLAKERIALALDATRKEVLEEAEVIYARLWNARTAEDPEAKDQFNNGILAGMTELMNAIRTLIDKPATSPANGVKP